MNYQNIVDLIRNTANLVNPTGHFVHGRNTDGSLDYDYSFPQIHLLPVETTYDIPNDIKTHTLILMFWEQDSPESTNLEREQKIAAMDVLSDNFLNVLYNINTINIEDVLKTPEYRQLAGTASGYGLSFSIVSKVDCLPEPIQPCEGVVVLINGEFYTEIPSGESQNILVQYENGDPVGTIVGDIIEIPNPVVCEDATAVLKDTDGNILSTTNIPSGTSQDITAPDGSITVENTASTILATDTVLSDGSTTIVIPDITFTDSDGSTSSVPAGQNITASPCLTMTADFSADILTPNVFQNIQFTDLTDNSPTNWGWDFGDGTLSALQNPVKSYNALGSFNVTLLAGKNNLGDVITKTGYIVITGDPDATAFINAAGITDATQQSAVTQLVIDLKNYGIWSKMKAIYPFVGGTANSHKYNLKDPQDTNAAFRLVFNGGWTHSSTGAAPNGTNAYADTFLNALNIFNPSDAHMSYYSRTNTANVQVEMGYWNLSTLIYHLRAASISNFISSISSNLSYTTTTDSRGFWHSTKRSNSDREIYRNGISEATLSITDTTAWGNFNIYIGARNDNGTPGAYSTKQCAFSSIGDGLTDTENANLYTAVQAYQTTLGRQV